MIGAQTFKRCYVQNKIIEDINVTETTSTDKSVFGGLF